MDPLAEKYLNLSPYVYVANNPIIYIDPDGQRIIIANNRTKAATNLAKIAATTEGQKHLNTLIRTRTNYTVRSIFWTENSGYDFLGTEGPVRTIYYPGTVLDPFPAEKGGGRLNSMVVMGHELKHAYDHHLRENMFDKPQRERSAVGFANYLRSVYEVGSLRTRYTGQRQDGSIFKEYFSSNELVYNPNLEKITDFNQIDRLSNNGTDFLGFSYNKSVGGGPSQTEYIITTTTKDGIFLFVKFNSRKEYEERLKEIRGKNQ